MSVISNINSLWILNYEKYTGNQPKNSPNNVPVVSGVLVRGAGHSNVLPSQAKGEI